MKDESLSLSLLWLSPGCCCPSRGLCGSLQPCSQAPGSAGNLLVRFLTGSAWRQRGLHRVLPAVLLLSDLARALHQRWLLALPLWVCSVSAGIPPLLSACVKVLR